MLVSAIAPAFADVGSDLNSYWAYTTPTINGTLALGEWTDANVVNFQLPMKDSTGTIHKTLNATLYVKNDYSNLYVAVQVFNDTYWAQDFSNRWKGLAVLFNYQDNGTLGHGENGEGITTWKSSPFYSKNDLYYDSGSFFWDADVNIGKTNDGKMNFTHTHPSAGYLGNWTFEMSIPLVGSDLGYDFNIPKAQLPRTVGFKVWFLDNVNHWDGVYPDVPPFNPLDQTTNAKTYGDLIINPLYTLTITTTGSGITAPAPGQHQYGYGTSVSVTATPSLGWLFDHWELDTVNVGATNPYVVTMNQNHTLLAVFKTIPLPPPPPVGGFSLRPTALPSLAYYGMSLAVLGAAVGIIRRKKR